MPANGQSRGTRAGLGTSTLTVTLWSLTPLDCTSQ